MTSVFFEKHPQAGLRAKAASKEIDKICAESLALALITDTGNFTNDAVRPSSFECAAELQRLGADMLKVSRLATEETINVTELRRRAFASLEFWEDGRVATIALRREDFDATACGKEDTDSFPEIPRRVKGCVLSAFFYPLAGTQDSIRVSVRSRPESPISAREAAEHFCRDDHLHSAGGVFHGSVEAARTAFRSFVRGRFSRTPDK